MRSATDLLSPTAAGALLGVSARQVRRLAGAGDLVGTRVGRDWVFRRADVVRFDTGARRKPGQKRGAPT